MCVRDVVMSFCLRTGYFIGANVKKRHPLVTVDNGRKFVDLIRRFFPFYLEKIQWKIRLTMRNEIYHQLELDIVITGTMLQWLRRT